MNMKIDPWSALNIDDYSKLFDEFGIQPFDDMVREIENPHKFMSRKIIFGHRNYDRITDAMNNNKPFSVMERVHAFRKDPPRTQDGYGRDHLAPAARVADAFVGIADREAHAVRGMSWEKCSEHWCQ